MEQDLGDLAWCKGVSNEVNLAFSRVKVSEGRNILGKCVITNTLEWYIFVVVNFDALAQANDFQIERRQVVFLCWMRDLNQGLWNRQTGRLNARWQTDWAIKDQAKNLNSTARPYDQRTFSPLDPTTHGLVPCFCFCDYKVERLFNTYKFLRNGRNRHPIAHTWGRSNPEG